MPTSHRDPLQLGVLVSGGGTTLENLIVRIRAGRLQGVALRLVISSRSDVRGADLARAAGLPLEVIRQKDWPNNEAFSTAITAALDRAAVDLVVLAGFLCFWRVPPHYADRALNIHPALLPRYGGRGFYGARVHAAVLAAHEPESGCTVHLVDNEYDHGPIVAQARVPVLSSDTPATLSERVGQAERELYPQVIQRIADEGFSWLSRLQAAR